MSILKRVKDLVIGTEKEMPPALGRNDRCWCNSGKKYKSCHMASDDRRRSSMRAASAPSSSGGLGF
jgi:hypothetical protein